MLLNSTTAVSTPAILLVPYRKHHVLRYHEWMKSSDLQAQTASEPLTLEEEYDMQLTWQNDADKITFISCRPLLSLLCNEKGQGEAGGEIIISQEFDVPERMIGDVNLFLGLAHELDDEGLEQLDRPYVRGEVELMIASPSDQGRGFGRATLLAFLQYVRNHASDILNMYMSQYPDGFRNHVEHGGKFEENAERRDICSSTTGAGLVLVAKINENNMRSRRLFESVGFVQVGEEDYFGEVELKFTGDMDDVKSVDGWRELNYMATRADRKIIEQLL